VQPETHFSLQAGPNTDLFTAPDGSVVLENATMQLLDVEGDFQLRARVSAPLASTFDAGALVVYASAEAWGKLALERSPQGDATIVSVVTRGVSDDANSFRLSENTAWLRVSRSGETFAFHASDDGLWWSLIRWFTIPGARGGRPGFLAQSPTGDGLLAQFDDVELSPDPVTDLRDGS
jgi:uncharacterized protein